MEKITNLIVLTKFKKAKNKILGCKICIACLVFCIVLSIVFSFIFPNEFSPFAAAIIVFSLFAFAPIFKELSALSKQLKLIKKRINPNRKLSDMP